MFKIKSVTFYLILSFILTNNDFYKCKTSDTENAVEIGNEVTLCIHTLNSHKKVPFKLKVDEYTIISVKEGFSNIVKNKEKDSGNNEDTSSIRRLNNIKFRNLINNEESDMNDDINDGESSDEAIINDEIKEEFLGQIGNVITNFPSVN